MDNGLAMLPELHGQLVPAKHLARPLVPAYLFLDFFAFWS